jgi:site-specific recombinase XerD
MSGKKIRFYDAKAEKAYLTFKLGNYDYHQLDQQQRLLVNTTEALTEFQMIGRIIMGARKLHPKVFEGSVGRMIKAFIDHRGQTLRLAGKTIESYIFHLYPFYCHVNRKGINISAIKASEILAYIQQMDPDSPANKHVCLNILRCFFKYLYDQHILTADYSRVIPKDNYKNQAKLPSTFTDEEINALLTSVDRGNPRGKRDYAILLLATKLGLRASDICGLTFDNIIWDRNIIALNQHKTGKALELPLLPEVGNAIVDYLKYGRPTINDSHCFIHVQGPYERIHTSDIGNLVRKYITLAKINYSNRRHGPHALRHSFASALLREKVSLPVISEALGHSGLASTMDYLRIDINTLKKCALEVPRLSSSFYEQKGGYRHD